MPWQQPQVSVVQRQTLLVMSPSSSYLDFEFAVLREVRVVVQLRDLVHAQRQHPVFNFAIRRFEQALKPYDRHALNSRHHLSRCDDLAQENAFAEREIVRVEKAEPATGQNPVAEHIKQGRLDVGTLILRQSA